jgi:signal transduction histidine kinase
VQLQQILMNLVINGLDAMADVDGNLELASKSRRAENRARCGGGQRYRRGPATTAGGPDLMRSLAVSLPQCCRRREEGQERDEDLSFSDRI